MTWRRAHAGDLPLASLWALAAVVVVAAAPLLPLVARLFPPCVLHALTGIPCLACGSTRSALALARGDWLHALALNPLAAMSLMVGISAGFVAPFWVVGRAPLPRPEGGDRVWRTLACLALAAQWIYLIAIER